MESLKEKSFSHRWGSQLVGFRKADRTSEKLGDNGICLGLCLLGSFCCLPSSLEVPLMPEGIFCGIFSGPLRQHSTPEHYLLNSKPVFLCTIPFSNILTLSHANVIGKVNYLVLIGC